VSNYKYFTDAEVQGLDRELCAKLDLARSIAGVPFEITSGLRTPDQNAALKGSASDSSHLRGLAVDLAVFGDDHAFNRMILGLVQAGLGDRMGFYYELDGTKLIPRHIHVDSDASLPPQVTWNLLEQNGC